KYNREDRFISKLPTSSFGFRISDFGFHKTSRTNRHSLPHSNPWFFPGNIDEGRFGSIGWCENSQNNQRFTKRIVGSMHLAFGYERDIAGIENAMFSPHPLLRLPGNNINYLFP